ncbi:hypothetical protein OQH61_03040 [Helicobacter sp. MIT 21-1697]|uniref:hypothetical protein n=1 Tax=Helicobacter sp. MIT 21-1697 TaxID=2993733 RepID=UPI00224B6DA6|nr:hypothetical protein [Helicobacter sp. MIT 21-1697]MCX2716707.1 hypothetical protein [Helicobacter sp. MIT 21-1697]
MNKYYISFAVVTAMAISANAVEVNPFGHLGAFYHQGFGGLGIQNKDGKEVQRAYANISARAGLDIGLSSSLSIGIGAWGGYPAYSTGVDGAVGDIAFPKNGDVSDAYLRYDGGRLSFALGRFDMGEFYLGKDGKNYTGVDWIYGNVQGAALNIDGGAVSLWAYWRNSQLGAGQAYNRMGYELSSFDTYQHQKANMGELFSGGIDIDFGALKVSPFVSYLTDENTKVAQRDILNAGGKALLDVGSGALRSFTTLRAVWGIDNIAGSASSASGLTLWVDEEVRISDIFKIGLGYINQGKNNNLLNYGDRARFYGYRGGMSGAGVGNFLGYGDTYYVFGGVETRRAAIDLLYAGGDYEEISAIGSVKIWQGNDKMHLSLGAGYVGTGKVDANSTLGNFIGNVTNGDKWQHSALAFAKFGF